jgi:hypothetical protein
MIYIFMGHDIVQKLINFWSKSFFTEPILMLSFIFCFAVGLFRHYRNKIRFFFLIYFLSGIILFVPVSTIIASKVLTEKQVAILQESSNTFFELVEFFAFYYFFQLCLQSNQMKKVLRLCLYILLAIITIFFIKLTLPSYSVYKIRVHSLLST